jgi:ElaA protein
MIRFITKTFEKLSPDELYRILQLRSQVFVVEQACIYLDADGKDRDCLHVLGYENEEGSELAAYARLVPAGYFHDEPAIGRVLTSPAHRKAGYGRQLMSYSISETLHHFHTKTIVISAQHYLEAFYTSLGFETNSEVYLEDNIPHIKMSYQVP